MDPDQTAPLGRGHNVRLYTISWEGSRHNKLTFSGTTLFPEEDISFTDVDDAPAPAL